MSIFLPEKNEEVWGVVSKLFLSRADYTWRTGWKYIVLFSTIPAVDRDRATMMAFGAQSLELLLDMARGAVILALGTQDLALGAHK